ncbi:MAG: AMP-binding protein, partial [Clostridiales bacterium]|nr:AMP-binding protein [Candidatus Scatonaster coprocaballi]
MKKIRDIYPLTPLQEGMYFHNELDPNDSSYHLQSFYLVNQRINETFLKISLKCLTNKYELFKTAFAATKATGVVKQVILEEREIEYSRILFDQDYNDNAISEHSTSDLRRGFNLKNDSLMRVTVLSFADRDVLFIACHHIITDGWSNPLVVADMIRFYNMCLLGKIEREVMAAASEEKRHILSFGEYLNWIQGIKKDEMKKYWDDYLDGYDSSAELSPLEKVEDFEDVPVVDDTIFLERNVTDQLNRFAKHCDATISSVSQLAFGLLLQKHCGTDDVLFGNVVSGRNVPLRGIENAVGLFINTIPLRIHAENSDTVETLLRRLQKSNNESNSYDHAALSSMKVNGQNVSDYIKHLFVFENYPGTTGDVEESSPSQILVIEPIFAREQTNYDLSISSFLMDDQLGFKFSYAPSKYTAENIGLFKSHLLNILRQIANAPSTKVSDITVCDEKERQIVIHDFNATKTDYPREKTIVELFEEQVEKTPDNIAVVFEDEQLTYTELNEKANQVAYRLRELGV